MQIAFYTNTGAVLYSPAMHTNKIDYYRKMAGLTVDELAKRAGMSRIYLSEVKSGKKNYNERILKRLAIALNVRPNDLISDDPPASLPVIGKITAGCIVTIFATFLHLIDDAIVEKKKGGDKSVLKTTPVISDVAGLALHVLEVEGDENHPYYRHGDRVYVDMLKKGHPDKMLDHECIVMLDDKTMYVCANLMKGSQPETYSMLLYNRPPKTNVRLQWAAPVYGKMRLDGDEGCDY